MNQEQYFERSKEANLPLRCPILNYCERRAFTIYLNSEYNKYHSSITPIDSLKKAGDIPEDFEFKKIETQGEPPSIIRGHSHFYTSNMCPEVNLFDNGHSLFPKTACTEGDYDNYRKTSPKTQILKCGHFSECPEFNMYVFEKGLKSQQLRVNKKNRKSIPSKTKALLQKEIKSSCPFCNNEDVDHFQIHHIDEDPQNNDIMNLIMLCPTCHSKITKSDITEGEVREIKNKLNSNVCS